MYELLFTLQALTHAFVGALFSGTVSEQAEAKAAGSTTRGPHQHGRLVSSKARAQAKAWPAEEGRAGGRGQQRGQQRAGG